MLMLPKDIYKGVGPSSADCEDERCGEWAEQRRRRGFDDTEIWNLDTTFALLMAPRLEVYRNSRSQKDSDLIQRILDGLRIMCSTTYPHISVEEERVVNESLVLFAENIRSFWF